MLLWENFGTWVKFCWLISCKNVQHYCFDVNGVIGAAVSSLYFYAWPMHSTMELGCNFVKKWFILHKNVQHYCLMQMEQLAQLFHHYISYIYYYNLFQPTNIELGNNSIHKCKYYVWQLCFRMSTYISVTTCSFTQQILSVF